MNPILKKILIAAIPIVIGAAIVVGINRRSGTAKATPPATAGSLPAVDGSQPAPKDAAHELAALAEELKMKPGHPPILMRLAELERSGGHADKAAAHLQEILKQEPANEEARLELGRALFESNDIEGAIRETGRLVKDYPTNVDGLYNLGAIHANLNQFDQATAFWKRAIAANPASDSGKRAQDGLAKLSQASAPGHGVSPHGDALLQDMLSKR